MSRIAPDTTEEGIATGDTVLTYGQGLAVYSVERYASGRICCYWVRWGRRSDGGYAGGGQRYRGADARTRSASCFAQVTGTGGM